MRSQASSSREEGVEMCCEPGGMSEDAGEDVRLVVGSSDAHPRAEANGGSPSRGVPLGVGEMGVACRPENARPWARCGRGCKEGAVLMAFAGGLAAALMLVAMVVTPEASQSGGGGSSPKAGEPPGGGQEDRRMFDYKGRPRSVSGNRGVVASDQGDCSEIGAAVLREGGTAADAAVATALCLGVKNPFASGIGGGAFIMSRLSNGTAIAIDSREYAPSGADQDMYTTKDSRSSLDGGLSVAVPLELLGLREVWERHGRLPWARLVLPAADLARGFPAHPLMVASLDGHREQIINYEPLRAVYLKGPDFRVPSVGELCCQRPQLRRTLLEVAKHGPSALFRGEAAQALAGDIQAQGGLVTAADLSRAAASVLEPLQAEVFGMRALVFPPPSSAAVVVSILKQVERREVPVRTSGVLGGHWLMEAMKHAFALRMSLGDPGNLPGGVGVGEAPFLDRAALDGLLDDMLSADYARTLVEHETMDNQTQPPSHYGGTHKPEAYLPEDHGTSHLSVVDAEGNAVSLTSTINTGFGSKVYSPSTGVLLNNEMDDFSTPGRPNIYGLAPSPSNFIRPMKKPQSSMSPMIFAGRGGGVKMVVGASGGSKIISAVVNVFLNHFDGGLPLEEAMLAPRMHHQLYPDRVQYESFTGHLPSQSSTSDRSTWDQVDFKLAHDLVRGLAKFGHTSEARPGYLGNCQSVVMDADGYAEAVSDARKDGAPAAA